jgi:hypothetical protein
LFRHWKNALASVVIFSILNLLGEKGRAANLIKESSKRKRTRSELEEVKDEELLLK